LSHALFGIPKIFILFSFASVYSPFFRFLCCSLALKTAFFADLLPAALLPSLFLSFLALSLFLLLSFSTLLPSALSFAALLLFILISACSFALSFAAFSPFFP
jgi:hypothetical protein